MAITEWKVLQEGMGVTFANLTLLQQSLVHRSYLNENPEFHLTSNERLEFLGDALLGFVVAEKLFTDFPSLSEGELTKLRAALVRKKTLARLAQSLCLGDYLYLGKGEEQNGGRRRQSNLASALEAVMGAVLVDSSFATAKDFVLRLLRDEFQRAREEAEYFDYKSKLQEVAQARQQMRPVYRTVEVAGPDHDREFTVEVMIGEMPLARGTGKSKREAEEEAARQALDSLPSS